MSSSDADTINSVIGEDKAPSMQHALDERVTLIRGLWNDDTQSFDRVAEVRELDGSDEEALATFGVKSDLGYGDYLTEVLNRSVTRIGDRVVLDHKILNSLIIADRDILLLQTMRATYGEERAVQAICPSCEKKSDIVIELSKDFPITLPDFPVESPIEVVGKKKTYRFNLPTGADTAAVVKAKNDAEANTMILSRCAVFAPGEEPSNRLEWARKISLGDRHKIVDKLLSIELGPKLGAVDTHCAHCDVEMPIALNWVSLLFS